MLIVTIDFGDYAAAPAPAPVSIPASPADALPVDPTGRAQLRPYTKWYRVWERHSLDEFRTEMIILPFILFALLVHFWGTRRNRAKARKLMAVTTPILQSEFALVGFDNNPELVSLPEGEDLITASAKMKASNLPEDVLKEKSLYEFESYASGRANVAFVDMKIILWKWYNPMLLLAEQIVGLFFESVKPNVERCEAVLYSFDGQEKNFVAPPVPGTEEIDKPKPIPNSTYDQFIFAIVDKLRMRRIRDERYDLSLTFTKENTKLPNWATTMSESAEITETLLTKDLVSAVERAGDYFDYIVVTDQPIDKPVTLNEATPKKRIHLSFKIPPDNDYAKVLPLFQAFLRLPDHLAANAHFRPEVNKKIKATRETESGKLKKVAAAEAEEDRMRQMEKLKKEDRDRKMKNMSADEQRKFLEKEAEKTRRKQTKKMSMKG